MDKEKTFEDMTVSERIVHSIRNGVYPNLPKREQDTKLIRELCDYVDNQDRLLDEDDNRKIIAEQERYICNLNEKIDLYERNIEKNNKNFCQIIIKRDYRIKELENEKMKQFIDEVL